MTEQEINKLGVKELRQHLINIYKNPMTSFYVALKAQIDDFSQQLNEEGRIHIFKPENKHVIDMITDFGEKGLKIKDTLKGLLNDIDPERLKEEQAKLTKAKRGSLEDIIKSKAES